VEAEHTALRRELAAAYEELDRLRQSGAPQPSRAKGSIADFRIWVPSVAGISMLFQLPSPFVLPAVGTAKRWFPSPFSRARSHHYDGRQYAYLPRSIENMR
jgi:hypothetical protein